MSQVETLTHTPPTRRLWMGPQFSFRTVTNTSNSPDHLREVEDEEEEDTAVLSPTHDLSDLLDICELHTNTSPLTAAERDSNTDPAVDSGEIRDLCVVFDKEAYACYIEACCPASVLLLVPSHSVKNCISILLCVIGYLW